MLFFDGITCLVLLLMSITFYLPTKRRPLWLPFMPILALVFAITHLNTEGQRWQMWPAYGVLIAALLWAFFGVMVRSKQTTLVGTGRWPMVRRVTTASVFITLILCSFTASYLFPMFDLPQPSGPHEVGSREFHFIDHERQETYTADTSDVRELMVQVWYPALPDVNSKATPYWRHAEIQSAALTKLMNLPEFIFSHLGLIATNSAWGAQLSDTQAKYPVLVFSHGYKQGSAGQNTSLMEALASHGYIVFSIDHAYVGQVSIYPNGRVASFDSATFARQALSKKALLIRDKMRTSTDWQEQIELLRQVEAMGERMDAMISALDIWAADQVFVLSEIEKLTAEPASSTQDNIFAGRLNLSQLGIFGMSFGGSTAVQTCVVDTRCKAGINFDGFMMSQIKLPPLEKPFMFINSENFLFYNAMFEKATGPSYALNIDGSKHINHSDFSIVSPLFQMMGALGSIEGYRMLAVTEAYVLAFFDKHLKGHAAPLLDAPSVDYNEVIFKRRNIK